MGSKGKQQVKQQQAQMQSDAIEMTSFRQGITASGSFEVDNDMEMSYSYSDIGQMDLFSEDDMRDKYPALKQAWEHYQSVLEVCKTKEKEDED